MDGLSRSEIGELDTEGPEEGVGLEGREEAEETEGTGVTEGLL